ncbi:hypothetical protein BKA69DRAFT_238021 [Paraphysoderma sedebokerense]|nr:hypothetical protein BKA69DRAFT_238021 [Paraphysoderma sedebokerense]
MVEERTIFGGAAESIILNCGNNEICVWDTNTTGSIYTLPNLSLSRTFSASVPIAFDPAVLTTADNQQFYLHRNPSNSAIYNLMRRTTSSSAPLASFSLPYTINYANPGGAVVFGYGRDQRGAGSVFAAFTTSTNSSVGRGGSDVIIGHYDCNGRQTDSIVLSTPLLDVLNNAAYVTTASGAANIIVVGTTDGDITNPTSTATSRRAFVSLFRPFTLTETTCFA